VFRSSLADILRGKSTLTGSSYCEQSTPPTLMNVDLADVKINGCPHTPKSLRRLVPRRTCYNSKGTSKGEDSLKARRLV